MADENEGGNGNENQGGSGGSGSGGNDFRFTQDDMTRVGAREKDQGRKAGVREVLDALGFESMEQAKQFAADLKTAGDAQLSEAQRLQRQAEETQRKAEQARNEAATETHNLRVERALAKAKALDGKEEKLSRLVECEVGSSVEDIASAVEDLKKDFPELFATEEGGEGNEGENKNGAPGSSSGTTPPPNSDPGRPPGTQQKGNPSDRAKSRLQERHGGRLARNQK